MFYRLQRLHIIYKMFYRSQRLHIIYKMFYRLQRLRIILNSWLCKVLEKVQVGEFLHWEDVWAR